MTPVRVFAAIFFAAAAVPHLVCAGINPETGSYIFQRYTPDGATPENWAVAQDQRGVMYFGNSAALLEFDGLSWRTIRLSNSSVARAVAVDGAGTVFVGGVGIFGLLRPDSSGSMQFVSLLDKVPQADRKFSDVWRILPTPEGVYFSAYERLFRLEPDGSLRVWRPVSNFGRAISIQDAVYVKTREQGLMKMEGDRLRPVAGGEIFKKIGVTAGSSAGGGGIVAAPTGLYRLDAAGIKPFPTAADAYFASDLLYTTYVFPDGEIAAGTRKGGLVLLNGDGSLDRILTRADGLTNDYISAIFKDRQGGVWLTGNNGINYVNLGLTRFDASLGLQGDVRCVIRAGGEIYAGTTTGLFAMKAASGRQPQFERIPGIEALVSELLPRGDQVLAATDSSIFVVADGRATPAPKFSVDPVMYDIKPSARDASVVYAVGRAGVFRLRREGDTWMKDAEFKVPGQEFHSAREDTDGRLWATTNEEIWRIDFRGPRVSSENYGAAQGAPAGWKNARLLGNRMVFTTTRGLRRWSETKRRFEPDPELGPEYSDGSRDVFDIFDDPAGNVWITGERYHDLLAKQAGGYRKLREPLLSSGIQEIYDMSFDADGTAWAFGARMVLYRWQRPLYGNPDRDFQVLVRRVGSTADNGTIYGGSGAFPGRLPWRENALRFEFAAPFSERPGAVEYQVKLEGSDDRWSEWGRETRKEYTHLSEGSYSFRVRARSPHGTIAENTAVSFGVMPPWYRSWWAYGAYLVMAGFGVWGIVGLRTQQLVKEKKQLEHIVEERTIEIREQRDEIQRQERQGKALLLNILPETVAEELKSSGTVRPVGFDDVTVCFTDFVGFTLSSEQLSPEALVDKLNLYFTAFDEIVARHGLEKLKTIGDAYMFASGLPAPRASHAVDAILAAQEMIDVVKSFAPVTGWDIRIGLNSGPVVAGVVGTRKFAFDIWGNTVNLASRMESSGVPGRVNLSERTCELTRGLFDCQARGHVGTKDGRQLPMFLVRSVSRGFAARYEAEFGHRPAGFHNEPVEAARAVAAAS